MRRLQFLSCLVLFWVWLGAAISWAGEFRLATFSVEVTPPVGHPCMGGGIAPVREVADPLFARGWVLTGEGEPVVLVSFDWCEIRGTSFDKWQKALAAAAGTQASKVIIHSTHVHDAPVMDEDAEKLLRDMEATGAWKNIPPPPSQAAVQVASVCWPAFNEECIRQVAAALKVALPKARRITHVGTGRAKVEQVASNRRYVKPGGAVVFNRTSKCTLPEAQAADAGVTDPWLHTLSFWDGDVPVCAMHSYAVHPMSVYGGGKVSADFPGRARDRMQKVWPGVFQIYVSGCAGNVTAGKWNAGGPDSLDMLAGRLFSAMQQSWGETKKHPLESLKFNLARMPLGARNTIAHTEAILRNRLATATSPFDRSESAMGLAWYERVKGGHQVQVPCVDFGPVQILLLPAEAYIEFQLFAQQCRPDSFVFTLGYGECGPGYIPTESAWQEKDTNLHGWAWTPPGSEAVMKKAIREALHAP